MVITGFGYTNVHISRAQDHASGWQGGGGQGINPVLKFGWCVTFPDSRGMVRVLEHAQAI